MYVTLWPQLERGVFTLRAFSPPEKLPGPVTPVTPVTPVDECSLTPLRVDSYVIITILLFLAKVVTRICYKRE